MELSLLSRQYTIGPRAIATRPWWATTFGLEYTRRIAIGSVSWTTSPSCQLRLIGRYPCETTPMPDPDPFTVAVAPAAQAGIRRRSVKAAGPGTVTVIFTAPSQG